MTEYRHHGLSADDRDALGMKDLPLHAKPRQKVNGGNFRRADHLEAASQGFRVFMGLKPPRNPHPMADDLIRQGDFNFTDLATSCLEMDGHQLPYGVDGRNIMAAMTTESFPTIISETARGVSVAVQSEQMADLKAISTVLYAHNYHPQSWSSVDLEGVPAPSEWTTENDRYHQVHIRPTGESFKILAVSVLLGMREEALLNDDRNLFRSGIQAFRTTAIQNEAKMAFGLLESNPTLLDGSAVFTGENAITAGLDAAGLALAYAALRQQKTQTGEVTNAAPAVLLVDATREVQALALVKTLPEDRRPRVVAAAQLGTEYWYLLADPASFPVLGRVTLVGEDGIRFDPPRHGGEFPGIWLPARHTVGYSIVGRVGAVRAAFPV